MIEWWKPHKKRKPYQWGAKQYLASFAPFESRLYDERFPWRSLASIGARLGREYGMKFRFLTDKRSKSRIIIREI